MTDRYYPKGLVPTYKYDSTYNIMNRMATLPRSDYPPGYSGHEHGKKEKYGYGNPAPDPLPQPPIDPEDPLVNFNIGQYIVAEPLPNRELILPKRPPAEETLPKYATQPFLADEGMKPGVGGADEKNLTFTSESSAYLRSKGASNVVAVDKDMPYTPAAFGRGTGFNSASSYVSWLPPGKIASDTTTADAYPPPVEPRNGLAFLSYTKDKVAA